MLRAFLLASALSGLLAAPARAVDFVALPAPAGGGWLSLPATRLPVAVAILVPDAAGRRAAQAQPYVAALLAEGIVVLEIEAEDEAALYALTGDGQARDAIRPDMPGALASARDHIAHDALLGSLPVGLVGFGAASRYASGWQGTLPFAIVRDRCIEPRPFDEAGPALCARVSLVPVGGRLQCQEYTRCAPGGERSASEAAQGVAMFLRWALRAPPATAASLP